MPSFGYRAVHIVTLAEGQLVEVQVRTRLQDEWAQLVESLEAALDRDIHYGVPPLDPGAPLGRPGGPTKDRVYRVLAVPADAIDAAEQSPFVPDRSLTGLLPPEYNDLSGIIEGAQS